MNLVIVGNGFDIAHDLPTKYKDFRDYLIRTNGCKESYRGFAPDSIMDNHGGEVYKKGDVVGYLVRVIGDCGGDDWGDLETYLGGDIFDTISYDFESIDIDDAEEDIDYIYNRNKAIAKNNRYAFSMLKQSFYEWVRIELGSIDYNGLRKDNVMQVLADGNYFLSFNYTRTLELVYGIDAVCHMHGLVGDKDEDILFGHGDERIISESDALFGAEDYLNELKSILCKNVHYALEKNDLFFDRLSDVTGIYSFGFSFSNADLVYIDKIAQRAKGATWFLNSFVANDSKNIERIINIIRKSGFKVGYENRW